MSRAAPLGALGVALGAYALWERRWYQLADHEVTVRAGLPALDVLHLSDTHLKRSDRRLISFLHSLPERLGSVPDLVLATGDLIEDNSGIDPLIECLSAIDARYGRFYVLGSHDYYQAEFKSYLKYFTGKRGSPLGAPPAATEDLEAGLSAKGWVGLTNRAVAIETQAGTVRIAGVDDPYIRRHQIDHIGRAEEVLAIGLMHAPDLVSDYALNGFDLMLAGHTHAGQVRFPVAGALVTNCSLPAALAGGLHRVGDAWLHVSPGLGTGKFQPIRFNCRPEATLLRLRPQRAASAGRGT